MNRLFGSPFVVLVSTNGTYGREDDVALGYDCCMERFGEGEYGYRIGTHNRFSNGFANGVPMSADEPLHNTPAHAFEKATPVSDQR